MLNLDELNTLDPDSKKFETIYAELLGRAERCIMEDVCSVPEILMILEEVRTTIRERYIHNIEEETDD